MTALKRPEPACLLTEPGHYAELLSIRPIAAAPDSQHLLIQSRLDSARNPEELRTRYSVTLTRAAIERLHAHLGDYLAEVERRAEPPGHGRLVATFIPAGRTGGRS
ncbi:MAG: hypothetical protein JSR49_11245 [Proteobacteria bacterium]|nr:hypothetical protein [Pseudomonadota bacterium]